MSSWPGVDPSSPGHNLEFPYREEGIRAFETKSLRKERGTWWREKFPGPEIRVESDPKGGQSGTDPKKKDTQTPDCRGKKGSGNKWDREAGL